jgi:hypothetical protein
MAKSQLTSFLMPSAISIDGPCAACTPGVPLPATLRPLADSIQRHSTVLCAAGLIDHRTIGSDHVDEFNILTSPE